jgi:hypothetical protein
MAQGERFAEFSKAAAQTVSRRQALRLGIAGLGGAALAGLGLGNAGAAPSRCSQICANEPAGPRRAACKQACKQCGGDLSRICFGAEIICCPPETSCCEGPTGTVCCPADSVCVGGECVGFVECTTAVCGTDPCNTPCGSNPTTGLCLCATTAEATCACFQPICGDPCTTSADCPDGFACAADECCGGLTCVPLCDTPLATAQSQGRWAA